jgi:hypothetical protein
MLDHVGVRGCQQWRLSAEWLALPAFLYTSNICMFHYQGVGFINRTSKFEVVKIFRGD